MNRPFGALCLGLLTCALWVPLRGHALYAKSDLHGFLVPEIALHLGESHEGALALWDPYVELGRPAIHYGGLSPAYWLCRVVSWFSDDPWQAYTLLVLATLVLGGLFAFGLFRALELDPWASAAAALFFAFAPFQTHTALYVSFASGTTWTMGLAFALVRLLRARTFGNGLLFALVVHSALLASYPQQVVWSAWLGLVLLVALWPRRGERGALFLALAGWGAVAVLASVPVLADLVVKSREAVRQGFIASMFDKPLPMSARTCLAWLGELGDPLLDGRKRFASEGLWGSSLTPLGGAAVLVALFAVRTRLVRWLAGFVGVTLLLTFVRPTYVFAAQHLGLGLSLFLPFGAALAPCALLVALGLDHCLRVRGGSARVALVLLFPVLALAGAIASGKPLVGGNVAALIVFTVGALVIVAPRPLGLTAVAVGSAFYYGTLSLPNESRAHIERRIERVQPLVKTIAEHVHDGRFTWFGRERPLYLSPNTEQLYGLSSIQSYDSLAPRRYEAWTERVSARGSRFHGRFFESITDLEHLATPDFRRADVRVLLSKRLLAHERLRSVARVGPVYVYEIAGSAPRAAWVSEAACAREADGLRLPPAELSGDGVERRTGPAERIALALLPRAEPGVLWLGQQFHPHWRARSEAGELATVLLDGFWQGVLVPPGTRELVLEFRPWVRLAWLPQLAFALAGFGLLARRWYSRMRHQQQPRQRRARLRHHAVSR